MIPIFNEKSSSRTAHLSPAGPDAIDDFVALSGNFLVGKGPIIGAEL
jgi:hypothetical protein